MSRACQAGCQHGRESHESEGVRRSYEHCRECAMDQATLGTYVHEFETKESLRAEVDALERRIGEIMVRAYKFDDKPHQLFSGLRQLAITHVADDGMKAEIVRLMDEEYERMPRMALASFLADLFSWMRTPEFFGMEVSEDICPILQRHGFVEFVQYDPELHGEIDCAEPGDNVWAFTDAMKRIADMKAE